MNKAKQHAAVPLVSDQRGKEKSSPASKDTDRHLATTNDSDIPPFGSLPIYQLGSQRNKQSQKDGSQNPSSLRPHHHQDRLFSSEEQQQLRSPPTLSDQIVHSRSQLLSRKSRHRRRRHHHHYHYHYHQQQHDDGTLRLRHDQHESSYEPTACVQRCHNHHNHNDQQQPQPIHPAIYITKASG